MRRKIHSDSGNKEDRTRCGLDSNYQWLAHDDKVTCKRCLANIKWERTGNKIIISDNETE